MTKLFSLVKLLKRNGLYKEAQITALLGEFTAKDMDAIISLHRSLKPGYHRSYIWSDAPASQSIINDYSSELSDVANVVNDKLIELGIDITAIDSLCAPSHSGRMSVFSRLQLDDDIFKTWAINDVLPELKSRYTVQATSDQYARPILDNLSVPTNENATRDYNQNQRILASAKYTIDHFDQRIKDKDILHMLGCEGRGWERKLMAKLVIRIIDSQV